MGHKSSNKARRLKPASREPRFKKLRALNCFEEMLGHMEEGWPLDRLAAWIQDDKKEYLDVSLRGLEATLRGFRDAFPPGKLLRKAVPRFLQGAMDRIDNGLNELDELEALYRLQMRRIAIDVELEVKFKKLIPSVTQEVRVAREILSTMAELKIDMGMNPIDLGGADVNQQIADQTAAVTPNERVARVLANPEKRQRLRRILSQVANRAGKAGPIVIDAEALSPETP